jgi:pimeloyl-ACP methyl ester carboxylesterase
MSSISREQKMPTSKPAFVFVHGAWHSGRSWDKIVPLLESAGHHCVAIDLPGAGQYAKFPESYARRPLDIAEFATEPSPNAAVSQAERTNAVVDSVKKAAQAANGKVVLVGHSMGGVTISAAAEAVPDLIDAVVYLTAFMLPTGMPAIAMIQHETMASAVVPALFMADPMVIGALRIDTGSTDNNYRAILKSAFYGDVNDDEISVFTQTLHCDEPAAVVVEPSPVTPERFGQVNRHYVRCNDDQAITPEGQAFMIAAMDAAMGNATKLHALETSHSPFLSAPGELAGILKSIAG